MVSLYLDLEALHTGAGVNIVLLDLFRVISLLNNK